MMTFLATVHIIACLALIVLALIQDSKGGGMFSSQTSSNSVLGATGGASLAVKMTKIVAFIVLVTCVSIAMIYSKQQKSVVDGGVMATQPMETSTIPTTTEDAATIEATEATPSVNTEEAVQQ